MTDTISDSMVREGKTDESVIITDIYWILTMCQNCAKLSLNPSNNVFYEREIAAQGSLTWLEICTAIKTHKLWLSLAFS